MERSEPPLQLDKQRPLNQVGAANDQIARSHVETRATPKIGGVAGFALGSDFDPTDDEIRELTTLLRRRSTRTATRIRDELRRQFTQALG